MNLLRPEGMWLSYIHEWKYFIFSYGKQINSFIAVFGVILDVNLYKMISYFTQEK